MLKRIMTVAALVLVMLVAIGCGGQGEGAKSGGPGGDKKAIKIGVIGAFQLTAGKEIQDAAKMAVDEINQSGGILGRPVEAVYADTKANPEEGKAAVERLLFNDKVDFIIGEHRSEVALAVQPIIMENKTIFINTGSASPKLSDVVVQNYAANKYTFRTFMNSKQMSTQFIKQLHELVNTYKFDKIAVIAESAVWTEPIIKATKEQLGSKIVLVEQPATDAKDFSIELSKVEKSGAQLVFALFSADQGLVFARQWNDRQIPALITGYTVQAQGPKFWEQTEGKAQGVITWKHGVRSQISEKTIPFWDGFKNKYGRVPGPYTGISTYDAFLTLTEAIKKAGTTDSETLVKTLEGQTFTGASGKIKFAQNHDPEISDDFVPFTFIQWQKGEMVTVGPVKYKTGELVFPEWMKTKNK